jgi:hypothetical protein
MAELSLVKPGLDAALHIAWGHHCNINRERIRARRKPAQTNNRQTDGMISARASDTGAPTEHEVIERARSLSSRREPGTNSHNLPIRLTPLNGGPCLNESPWQSLGSQFPVLRAKKLRNIAG